MARERMSNMDSVFVHIEDPTNLMMVTGVMIMGAPVDHARLGATIERRLLQFDRFRQRIVRSRLCRGNLYWEDDPGFDLAYHLRRASLPPPGDQAALQEAVSLLASTPLDLSRPPWQFHLIENYGQGSALICRLHHSLGDGMALVHVLLTLADARPDAGWPTPLVGAVQPPSPEPQAALLAPLRRRLKDRRRTARRLARKGLELLSHPARLADATERCMAVSAVVARLALARPDPPTILKGELGMRKQAAWSADIPLQDVRTVGTRLGGTVNDVLLAAVTGALRRYLHDRGDSLQDAEIRATIPVNMRTPGTEAELGNRTGVYLLDLPLGIADPAERLRELKLRMEKMKGSLEGAVTFFGLQTVGQFSPETQRLLVNFLGARATAVMTNVKGPQERLYLAGAPLEALLAWVPKSGALGIGVSILSYAGQIRVGVITDAGLVPDPEAIVAGFQVEFDALLEIARATPQPPPPSDLVAALEATLAALESILDGEDWQAASAEEDTPDRCQAQTKSGRRCRNRASSGSRFCHLHQQG
jgi:diacylglycerol O-acyltransferase